jgi:hypothetical protein
MKSIHNNIDNLRTRVLTNLVVCDEGYVRSRVREIIREEFMWIMSNLREAIRHEIIS